MLKKEFRDSLRILLESSLFLLAVPMSILASVIMGFTLAYGQLIKYTSIITIFAFAAYSGLGMFLWEKRDKGLEYLLTLPMSRLTLFLCKLLPRMILLLVLLGAWGLIFQVSIKQLVVVLIFIQLAAASLSLAFNSYFAAIIGIILLMFFYSLSQRFIWFLFYQWRELSVNPFAIISPTLLAALLTGIPLALSFLMAFKNLDLRPYKYTVKPYLFIAVPLLLAQVAVIFFFYEKVVFSHLR